MLELKKQQLTSLNVSLLTVVQLINSGPPARLPCVDLWLNLVAYLLKPFNQFQKTIFMHRITPKQNTQVKTFLHHLPLYKYSLLLLKNKI